MKPPSEIEVPVWVRAGGMMVRRDALSPEHPESTYNYIKEELKLVPEDFGYHICNLTEEQKKFLARLPDESLYAEMRRRESIVAGEEMFGYGY